MRMVSFVFGLVLAASGLASAQDWSEYQNIPDGFKIDFPGQPKMTETTWTSEYGYKLPARVYTADRGKERYSMTVVDYTRSSSRASSGGRTARRGPSRASGAISAARVTGCTTFAAPSSMRRQSSSNVT